jgi:ELWxxDGT repeat protein
MISCPFITSKADGQSQPRERGRSRVGLSVFVVAGLMFLMAGDGRAQDAHLVKNINSVGSSNPQSLTDVNGTLYFAATDATNGTELWKSDGTAAGTVMVENINSVGSSNPQSLTDVNGTLYFSATDGVNGTELWTLGGETTPQTVTDDNGCFIGTAARSERRGVNGGRDRRSELLMRVPFL